MNKIRKIAGINTLYGDELKKMQYISYKMYEAASKVGYEELQVPILEPSESYSEEVIGKSPWPEWNEKGCFYLNIEDYNRNYFENQSVTRNILIPEGTVSVTRWLGEHLDENSDLSLPLKIFYNLTCFRNEIISTLNENKKREFRQFGIEVLGASNLLSDIENLNMAVYLLNEIGIDKKNIRCRINHIKIFNQLCQESEISYEERIEIKELLDTLAECKAGKMPERYMSTINKVNNILKKFNLTDRQKECWEMIINFELGKISYKYYEVFGEKYKKYFDQLNEVLNIFKKNNVNIETDLCVIRSHEYYTGFSYEVDVVSGDKNFFEIAGGGRYDKLVKNFVSNSNIDSVPCTGFAFGMNRLKKMLEELNLYPDDDVVNINFKFNDSSKKVLVMVEKPRNYIETFEKMVSMPDYFSIYLGDDTNNIDKYKKINNFDEEVLV